ncbi:pyruvate kinase [Erysipelothrix rhusiopathiae]|nr:pyruvate kinase [Erysipelothrix rhusiopathiae]AMS11006.1 pyruvate kinase [Erysipelothrix rhusiopathiae]AOO67504.1 pyruvate kinase [Erysipelothrix rhusiopathiae]AWU41631.1 pyruvate kinase [Erysipelothrix rhusiopathiae]MCG4436131.1 pyruvate kinase [Erysipelothrix rhusiopathiae]MCG4456768.1 pyruvate kinase [Erysipelothrix rhusiopathiae]
MHEMKKTKIICTIGPASESPEMIEKLANEGMNIVRFNFSHDVQENHLRRMKVVREVSDRIGINLGILLDTKGPEIRCGDMENGALEFAEGDIVRVGFDADYLGNKERFTLLVPEVYEDVKVDDYLLIDDGKMKLTVIDKKDGDLVCRIDNPGLIKTRKGVNVPNVVLSMPFLSEKDRADITFGAVNGIDYVAASFVRRAQDVLDIREVIEAAGKPDIQIIVKIENQEGFDNIESILEVADGVMVARGDLGVEVSTHLVPIYQKQIIKTANRMGKPVVTATHMLESMQQNPRPTRAEASDVANAILDGTDAIMLSGESAVGAYPVEAVRTMAEIAIAMEEIIPYRDRLRHSIKSSKRTIQDSIGISIAETALNLDDVAAVIAFTQSGSTAKRISKYRPNVPVIAVTFTKEVQNRLEIVWGVKPVVSDIRNEMTNDDEIANTIAKNFGIEPGKKVIIAAGYPTGTGNTNTMKIIEIK